MPRAGDFQLEQRKVREPQAGELLVANQVLSIDPAVRGFLDDRPSYLPPVALGETVRGMALGRIIKSCHPEFPEGAFVRALAGWEEISLLGRDAIGLMRVTISPGTPLQHYMGVLGASGLTAWIGLNEIAALKAGETVVVSAAAGAVGNVACQIARLQGCRVIGLAGSPAKVERLQKLGLHAAIDYRAAGHDLAGAIRAASPEGVDVYFDNVGGSTLETLLPLMREHGRVAVCGMVSEYNDQDHPYGVHTLWQLVVKRLTLRGFLTYEHAARIPEAQAQLTHWLSTGALVAIENVREGLERAPEAFIDLMSGRTIGKTLVKLGEAR
jgi:NADPH-dependent curcumin reductase CurA